MTPAREILIHRVIGRLNVGGPAMHVVHLARALDGRHGPPGPSGERPPFRTRLIAGTVPPAEGDMAYYAADRGVEVTPLPEMSREVAPTADAVALWKLIRLFRRERPDVVHTHTAKAGALGRVAAAVAGVPVRVHTFHGHVLGGDYFSPLVTEAYRRIERQLARLTDRLVVLTPGQRDELALKHGVADSERFRVVPLGLELEPFVEVDRAAAGPPARAELGIPAGAPLVGVVGRLVPIKNHELLLEALARLRAGPLPDARLRVVGGGGREAELRGVADALGVAEAVTWAGWRTDLPRLYAAMDALALTSRDEGTPVAVIEALAAGTPVVARAVGGVPALLEGVPSARLVDVAEPGAVAEALAATLSGEAGEGGGGPDERRDIARRFSVERLASDLASLYLDELRRKGRPG